MQSMRLRWSKYGLVFLLFLGSCNDSVPEFELVEMDPKVVVSFNLVNNGEPIEVFEQFTDEEGYTCSVDELSFYVSDVNLVNAAGERTLLSEVELISFVEESAGNESAFKRSYSYIVPEDTYETIEFAVGLPPALNASDPTTFPNDHPLGTYSNGMFWDWASMYVFLRIGVDLVSDETQTYDFDMQIHTGTDSLYMGKRPLAMSLELPAFAKDSIQLDIEWNDLFHVDGATHMDLSEKIYTHGTATPEDVEMAIRFMTNFRQAISVHTP